METIVDEIVEQGRKKKEEDRTLQLKFTVGEMKQQVAVRLGMEVKKTYCTWLCIAVVDASLNRWTRHPLQSSLMKVQFFVTFHSRSIPAVQIIGRAGYIF